jgi:hypothetical protein
METILGLHQAMHDIFASADANESHGSEAKGADED